MKHLLIISLFFLFSCIENEKPLTFEEKEIEAIEVVNDFILEGHEKQNIPIFLKDQSVYFIEPYRFSELSGLYCELLFLVENFDSLSIIRGETNLLKTIEFGKKQLIFQKTFTGFKIHKHFHLYERYSPEKIQVFWIDLNLDIRAQSTIRSTVMYTDTIEGELTYCYKDTSNYIKYLEIWN